MAIRSVLDSAPALRMSRACEKVGFEGEDKVRTVAFIGHAFD
jgi:hypothetical protein